MIPKDRIRVAGEQRTNVLVCPKISGLSGVGAAGIRLVVDAVTDAPPADPVTHCCGVPEHVREHAPGCLVDGQPVTPPTHPRTPKDENEHLWALLNWDKPKNWIGPFSVVVAVSKMAHSRNGEAQVSRSTLAAKVGGSERSVSTWLDAAEKAGWLVCVSSKKPGKGGKTEMGRYRPTIPTAHERAA
ncbi:hypothetical protein [Streptomyces finlayi]|nr:hypothetical protein [Streptomyces finlayi]